MTTKKNAPEKGTPSGEAAWFRDYKEASRVLPLDLTGGVLSTEEARRPAQHNTETTRQQPAQSLHR